jgi:hypothetical protein
VFCAPGCEQVAHLAGKTHPDEGVLHAHKGGRARLAAAIAKRVDGRRDRFHRALARFRRCAHYFFLPPAVLTFGEVVGGGFFAPGLLGVRRLSAAVPLLGRPPIIRGRNELKRRSLTAAAAAAFLLALPPMMCDLLVYALFIIQIDTS